MDVTFAPKDVVPIDFTPKVDVKGLGYQGLNPQQALMGGGGSGNINLFTMDSDRASSLFGDKRKGPKHRGGVAGQVIAVLPLTRWIKDVQRFETSGHVLCSTGPSSPL